MIWIYRINTFQSWSYECPRSRVGKTLVKSAETPFLLGGFEAKLRFEEARFTWLQTNSAFISWQSWIFTSASNVQERNRKKTILQLNHLISLNITYIIQSVNRTSFPYFPGPWVPWVPCVFFCEWQVKEKNPKTGEILGSSWIILDLGAWEKVSGLTPEDWQRTFLRIYYTLLL